MKVVCVYVEDMCLKLQTLDNVMPKRKPYRFERAD